jgi:hypothetical protein
MKSIVVNLTKPPPKNKEKKEDKKVIEKKTPKKRVVTETDRWLSVSTNEQFVFIKQIHEKNIVNREPCDFILQQMRQKIGGYRGQDIHKSLYNEALFINISEVLELMIKCENRCFYCKETVNVLYENVREPKQWTLERIDNSRGHNKDNVEIACLNCNLHRKTMHHERYLFTKELNIIKKQN